MIPRKRVRLKREYVGRINNPGRVRIGSKRWPSVSFNRSKIKRTRVNFILLFKPIKFYRRILKVIGKYRDRDKYTVKYRNLYTDRSIRFNPYKGRVR